MADADALCEQLPQHPHARYAGLVLNERGYERARATGRLHEVCFVVCASDSFGQRNQGQSIEQGLQVTGAITRAAKRDGLTTSATRSEEHTSELQSLMRISYAVFCLKKKKKNGVRLQVDNLI